MHRGLWQVAVLATSLLLIVSLWGGQAGDHVKKPQAEIDRQTVGTSNIAGSASCSGRSCHGGMEPHPSAGILHNEYSTWLAHDKHAQAFAVLTGERGRRMARNLGIDNAATDARCLACHVTPQLVTGNSPDRVALRAEGVGCEACHGPSAGTNAWGKAHTLDSWKLEANQDRLKQFQTHGMTPLFDLSIQAETCARCHVGAQAAGDEPGKDLNHDLMAAGHPRLIFELGAYRANMPPHWKVAKDQQSAREVRLWAAGQVANAKAALNLLGERVDRVAKGQAPWPEFAETACFACHADLQNPRWRQSDYYKARQPGSLPLCQWNRYLIPTLAEALSTDFKDIGEQYAKLEKLMRAGKADLPALKQIANVLIKHLEQLDITKVNDKVIPDLARRLRQLTADTVAPDWDQLTQLALGAAALQSSGGNSDKSSLDAAFRSLAFKQGLESPEGYGPALESTRRQILQAFDSLGK